MALKSFCDICGRVDENPSLKIEIYEKSKLSSSYREVDEFYVCEDCKTKFEKMFADLRNNPGNESVLSYVKRLFGGKR